MIKGCKDLRNAVRKGPIAVSICATGWQNYGSGVFPCQPPAKINQAVLLVGYTPELNWIIKNSWGDSGARKDT